jgi:hypothetical protein
MGDDRMGVFIFLKHLLGAKSNAQAASFAPIGKYRNPCVLSSF